MSRLLMLAIIMMLVMVVVVVMMEVVQWVVRLVDVKLEVQVMVDCGIGGVDGVKVRDSSHGWRWYFLRHRGYYW